MTDHHLIDYYAEEWGWMVQYNRFAEGGPYRRILPASYDVEGLVERASFISDGYTIVDWSDDHQP